MNCIIIKFRSWWILRRFSWLNKNQKATLNPKNNDEKCLQYAITFALKHESIIMDPQKMSKIKSFINKYEWKEINFPSGSKTEKQLKKRIQISFLIFCFLKKINKK